MSQRDDLLYFGHMLDTAKKIVEFTARFDQRAYEEDEVPRLALLHLMQTLGEAAGRVSAAGRAAHPELPWERMIGLRNRIVHDYRGIRDMIIWDTAVQDIPKLLTDLEAFVPPDPPE
jgi:uncharacterized protein with HEPN domain